MCVCVCILRIRKRYINIRTFINNEKEREKRESHIRHTDRDIHMAQSACKSEREREIKTETGGWRETKKETGG